MFNPGYGPSIFLKKKEALRPLRAVLAAKILFLKSHVRVQDGKLGFRTL